MGKKKKEEFSQITKKEIEQIPIGKMVMDAFLDFGNYINNQRHTAFIYDGCKPSYRRLIFSGLQFPKGKMIPSTNFISNVANYHPHSLSGIEGLNANLVHSGVFTGEGSWGYTDINGVYNQYAAPRYTKERVSDVYLDILGDLWKEVPMVESPVGPMEISYLPLPLPLCLRGDTKVKLVDGRDLTLKEITEEFNKGKSNYVLSCSLEGEFSVSKIINILKTKTTNKYLKITLNNGEYINSTEDHLFLKRDRSYSRADKLKIGDYLMSGYIEKDNPDLIRNNHSNEIASISKLLSNYKEGKKEIYKYWKKDELSLYNIDKSSLIKEKLINKFRESINKGLSYEDSINAIRLDSDFSNYFIDIYDFIKYESEWGYYITNIEEVIEESPVDFYDITVDSKYHNFLLSSGIVVHNCLYMKTSVQGLGVGIKSDYPNFSPISIYNAYKNDDPNLLEPNANLFIDKENSELKKLWETGKGRVIYSYKVSRTVDSMGNPGVLFEGDTFLFTPNLKKFKKLVEDGKVYMESLTDIYGPKLIISKIPGARGITIEEIEEIAKSCCYDASVYNTNVTTGSTTYRIGLRDWVDFTYKNYISLITEFNKKKIEKTIFDISVLEAIPYISDYILNKNPKATDSDIKKDLGYSDEIISAVMSKPISYLRKSKDNSSRIKDLKDKLKELKSFDPVKYTEEIIKHL